MPRKFHLNLRKNFPVHRLYIGTDCPESLWSLPYWRCSRTFWTQSCAMCIGMTLLQQGDWTRWPTLVASNLIHSVIEGVWLARVSVGQSNITLKVPPLHLYLLLACLKLLGIQWVSVFVILLCANQRAGLRWKESTAAIILHSIQCLVTPSDIAGLYFIIIQCQMALPRQVFVSQT